MHGVTMKFSKANSLLLGYWNITKRGVKQNIRATLVR